MVFVRAETPAEALQVKSPRAVPRSERLWVDVLIFGLIGALFAGFIAIGREWAAPFTSQAELDLSLSALPLYTLLSLSRGLLAYLISLAFTIVYGTTAAHSRRAERVMLPILDILQSIPVLSFMPGFILGLVALFPHSNIGLELACVLAIFTGQVWNMTFSYHAALRAIPTELTECARLHRFGFWRRLTWLEVPSAMIGLVWNSMMSMAGGWFFLTVVESFRLGATSYRLPGLGSYMAAAIEAGDGWAMAGALAAMVIMIVLVDQLLWRPLIAWAERFKLEETAALKKPTSFVYDFLRRSRLGVWLRGRVRLADGDSTEAVVVEDVARGTIGVKVDDPRGVWIRKLLGGSAVLALGILVIWGGRHLAILFHELEARDWFRIVRALGLTAVRVLCAVGIGAAWAVPAGIAIGRSPRLSRFLQPVIQVAASFPAPMLFPLIAPALLTIGLSGNVIAVGLMLLGTQWYILFNVVAGAAAIPQDFRDVASVFRIGALARFVVLYLGGVFPYLVTGVITAAGGAWNASIVSESVHYAGGAVTVDGIGFLIASSFDRGNDAVLAASTLTLSVALVLVNRFAWRRLYHIADKRFAMNR